MNELIQLGFIKQIGTGPSTTYSLIKTPTVLPLFNLDEYFQVEVDKRNILGEKFNFDLINSLDSFFDKSSELDGIEKSRVRFKDLINNKNSLEVKKELERFIIELSWKSSKIEGNTYTLLDTENLIKNNIKSEKNTTDETQMILNHKYAFDYVLKNLTDFTTFTQKNLKVIHSILVKNLNIKNDYREHGVGIAGTKYLPLDNKYQIQDAINQLENNLQKIDPPIVQAFGTLVFISYIQPFADGNKKTARILSNAILLANSYYPLSYRSVDEIEYKKALIIFYEQFNIYYFKKLFLDQYKFSVDNYFK